jgi:hypothetical protein
VLGLGGEGRGRVRDRPKNVHREDALAGLDVPLADGLVRGARHLQETTREESVNRQCYPRRDQIERGEGTGTYETTLLIVQARHRLAVPLQRPQARVRPILHSSSRIPLAKVVVPSIRHHPAPSDHRLHRCLLIPTVVLSPFGKNVLVILDATKVPELDVAIRASGEAELVVDLDGLDDACDSEQ